jgi:hypothetical protein
MVLKDTEITKTFTGKKAAQVTTDLLAISFGDFNTGHLKAVKQLLHTFEKKLIAQYVAGSNVSVDPFVDAYQKARPSLASIISRLGRIKAANVNEEAKLESIITSLEGLINE